MKFFSLDVHVAVVEDLQTIWAPLGHQIDSVNMSGHMWTRKKPQSRGFGPVNSGNWVSFIAAKDASDRFYTDTLEKYDAFLVTYPASMLRIYGRYNKPIVILLCARYEWPFHDSPDRWEHFNYEILSMIRAGQVTLVANNAYDQAYFHYFTGYKPELVPSVCSYIDQYCHPRQSFGPNMVFDMRRAGYDYDDMASAQAHVNYPFNASTMSFFERYWLCVPQLAPSKDYMSRLVKQGRGLQEIQWALKRGSPLPRVGGSLPDPNDERNRDAWMELHDIYRMPHILYFEDEENLDAKGRWHNSPETRHDMQLTNWRRKAEAIHAWEQILKRAR